MKKIFALGVLLTISILAYAQNNTVISMTFTTAKPFYEVSSKKVYKKTIPGKYVFRLDSKAGTLAIYYTSKLGNFGRTLNIKSAENHNTQNGQLLTLGFDNSYERVYINMYKKNGKGTADITLSGNLFEESTWFKEVFCSYFGKDENGDINSEIYFPPTQNVTVER